MIQGIPVLSTYSTANPWAFVDNLNLPIKSPIRESAPHCKNITSGLNTYIVFKNIFSNKKVNVSSSHPGLRGTLTAKCFPSPTPI